MFGISYKEIINNGLWKNNAALVQLLGLCPLLAVSSSVVKATGISLATMLILTFTNIIVSLMRNKVSGVIKIPSFVIIIATLTTCTELIMKAFTYELYILLGIFVPLIVTNGVILGRANDFASKNNVLKSALDGIMIGAGFSFVLLTIGAIREILGVGTIFSNMDLLFGSFAANWTIRFFSEGYGFLIFVLPPGAFIIMGILIALKNVLNSKVARHDKNEDGSLKKGVKRIRTTGTIT